MSGPAVEKEAEMWWLVPSVEWFEGGVSRLLTLESAFTGERAGNLEVAFI
jgi:hypothetical protein